MNKQPPALRVSAHQTWSRSRNAHDQDQHAHGDRPLVTTCYQHRKYRRRKDEAQSAVAVLARLLTTACAPDTKQQARR